jgi:hypothetical protein
VTGVPSSPRSPNPPPFNDPNYETYKHGQQFLIVDHTANQRNGSDISKIWQHGRERHRVDDAQWIDIGGVATAIIRGSWRAQRLVEEPPAIPFATSRTATSLTSTPITKLFPYSQPPSLGQSLEPWLVLPLRQRLLGGQECRVKMTFLRSFSTPLIPYLAQRCQPSASESSAVQRSSLPLRETSWGRTLSRPANA